MIVEINRIDSSSKTTLILDSMFDNACRYKAATEINGFSNTIDSVAYFAESMVEPSKDGTES